MNVVTEFSSSEEEVGVALPRSRFSSNISRHTHNINMVKSYFLTILQVQFSLF